MTKEFKQITHSSHEAGIIASTTQTQGQQPLTADNNIISTVANTNDTVTLRSASPSDTQRIVNLGVSTLQIFPALGDDLGNGIDIPTTLEASVVIRFFASDETNWEIVTTPKVQNLSSPSTDTYLSTQGIRTLLDTEVVTKTESFDNFNARFLGEVGKPSVNTPIWTETDPGGKITLITETVLGTSRQVVKFVDDHAGLTGTEIPLVTADWTNINSFGASYGGIIRLDTIDSSGCVLLLQDNDVDKRYGIAFKNNGGFLRLDAADSADPFDLILDGLGGRPKILFDEWVKIEIVIPVGLGLADVFVNDVLLSEQLLFVTNSGGGGTKVNITSGSSSSTTRTFYVANYGVTIYKESSTKTISSVSMNAKNFVILVPPGKRDYEVRFPTGINRDIGDRFSVLAENVLGTVKFTTNPLNALITFEGLKTKTQKVENVRVIKYVNTINNANNYELDSQQPTRKIQLDGVLREPGDISYNTKLEVFEIKGLNTILQTGQEMHIPVINKTGGTLNDGDIVRINGYDATSDRVTVTKSRADNLTNALVTGMCTTTMGNDEEGKITTTGRVNDLDTSSLTEGDIAYLSPFTFGLFTTTKPSLIALQIGHVGKVDASIGYIECDIKQLDVSIRALISDSTDQTFTANVSTPIKFNTNNALAGFSHSETINNDEITFTESGNYHITVEPQYTRTTGGGVDVLNMYLQKSTDGGITFINIANSNIKVSISASGQEAVATLTQTLNINAGDRFRCMIQVEDVDLKLSAFPAFGTTPNDVPATPSVICNIHRIGD